MTNLVYISVGSNLGDRVDNCFKGIIKIGENKYSHLINCSSFYLTSPTDYESQNWFVNAAIKINTILKPHELLENLISIQNLFGRKKTFKFGPRNLDLDIVFYDNKIIKTHDLEIPHPRMQNRLFVLKPMCEIDSNFTHPLLGLKIGSLLDNLEKSSQKIISIDALINNKT